LAAVETVAIKVVHLHLQELQILAVAVAEHLEMALHEQVDQAVVVSSFFDTPAQFNISLVAQ
jgi:hypothetical protein